MLRILLFYHKKKNIYGVLSILWLHCTLHISTHMYDIFYSHNNMYNTHHNPRLPRNVLAFLFLLHHNPYIHTERYDNLHHIDLLKSLRKARYASLFLFFCVAVITVIFCLVIGIIKFCVICRIRPVMVTILSINICWYCCH